MSIGSEDRWEDAIDCPFDYGILKRFLPEFL
jgi:hypothetical protein